MEELPDLENTCVWMDGNFGEVEGRNRRQKDQFWREQLNKEFLKAVIDGDLDQVNKWIRYGASVHTKYSPSGDGVVHFAASLNDSSILQTLLNLGASPSAKNKQGQEPIHVAVWHESIAAVKALLQKDRSIVNSIIQKPEDEENKCDIRDPDACDLEEKQGVMIPEDFEDGTSPLHIASSKISQYILELLIYKSATVEMYTMSTKSSPLDVVGIHAKDPSKTEDAFIMAYNTLQLNSKLSHPRVEYWFDDGRCEIVQRITTTLHTAVGFGYLNAIEDLLERGACCGVWDQYGETPLHLAVKDRKMNSLLALLGYHQKNKTLKVDARNRLGWTAVHFASFFGKHHYVAVLLQGGADASLTTFVARDFFVGGHWNWAFSQFVYSNKNAGTDKEALSLTACCLAVMGKSLDCVKLLSMDGAPLKFKLENDMNMLHLAAWCNAPEITKFLIDKYIEMKVLDRMVNQVCEEGTGVNGYGMAPIHFAVFHSATTTEMIKLFVDKGKCDVKISAVSKLYGDATALHFAVIKARSWEDVELIYTYDKGVLNREDRLNSEYKKQDRLVLMVTHAAAIYNQPEHLREFLLRGADLSSCYTDGNREFTLSETIEMYVDDHVNYLHEIFDAFIEVEQYEHGQPDSHVVLNYGILAPGGKAEPQMRVLESLVTDDKIGEKQALLLHPLTETFLYLKWQKLKDFLNIFVGFYLSLAVLITALGYIRYVSPPSNQDTTLIRFLIGFVTTIIAIITTADIVQIVMLYELSRVPVIRTLLSLTMILSSYLTIPVHHEDTLWQRGVTALAILLSWTDLLNLLASYPWSRRYPLGLFYIMFLSVTTNLIKILSSFSLLILAFALSFMVLDFYESDSLITKSIFKAILMLMEYDDGYLKMNVKQDANLLDEVGIHIGYVVYLGFFLMVTIAMVNFMTGVAIDDIAELKKEGKARQLFEQSQILRRLERITNSQIDIQVPLSLVVFLKDSLHKNETIPLDMALAVKERVCIILQKRKAEAKAKEVEKEEEEMKKINRELKREATEEITKVVKDVQTKLDCMQQQIRHLEQQK